MENVNMIAVIYHDTAQLKRLVLVKNVEELSKLNFYYLDDFIGMKCYQINDVLLLNLQDEQLLSFLNRNDKNYNIMIPYLCFSKELQLNTIGDFKEPVEINACYPLLHEVFILWKGLKKYIFDSQMDFETFLKNGNPGNDFQLLKERKVHSA